MDYIEKKDPTFDLINPVVEGLGYSIVELNSRIVQRDLHVFLVVHRNEGVALNDCAVIFRTIQPRLEMIEGERDVNLEVSSPGLSRKLKTADELVVFKGRGVRYLLMDEDEWALGTIGPVDETTVDIITNEETLKIPLGNIRKMKLDDTIKVGR